MPELPIIIISFAVASVVFILLGRGYRSNSNEGAASVNYTIGFMLLISVVLLVILFIVLNVNVQTMEPGEPSEPSESVTVPR